MTSFAFEIGARTLWMEARGEPAIGQAAVAHVFVNRMKDGRWGRNLAAVCLSPLQFSCWNAKDHNRMDMANLSDDDPLLSNLRVTLSAAVTATSIDPTDGALFYYAKSIAEPDWAKTMLLCGTFGNQIFYRDK